VRRTLSLSFDALLVADAAEVAQDIHVNHAETLFYM